MADRYYSPYSDPSDAVTDDEQNNSLVGFTRPVTSPLSQPLGYEAAGLHGVAADARSDTDSDDTGSTDDSEDYYEASLQNTSSSPNVIRNDFIPPDRADLYRAGSISLADPQTTYRENGNMRYTDENFRLSAQQTSGVTGRDGINYGQTRFGTADRGDTSIMLINSEDRDRNAYPQPTELQLHFPKVYRNVTEFSLTQMKLLSAFLYFREQKFNTYFDVYELGRTTLTGDSNIIRVRIREGSYNINTLLQELMYQMNTPPVFFHFPNDFNDFAAIFSVNGDFAANFNLPGDYFYDAQLQKFVPNPTTDYIVTRYWPTRFAGQTSYTLNQLLIAYYYPVLKEALLDALAPVELALPGDYQNTYIRIVYNFQGLNDSFVLGIIEANINALDAYRDTHTFQNYLTNNYTWSYNTYNNRVTVASSNLNTSILNDFQAQTNLYLSNALAAYGLTFAQYQALIASASRFNAVLTSMYNYLQGQLANNFAVNYASYTIEQLASPQSQIFLQNGNNVSGVYDSYTPAYITAINTGQVKPLPNFDFNPGPPAIQWPNMSNLQQPAADIITLGTSTIVNTGFASRANIYNFTLSNIDPTITFTNGAGIIQADFKYGSAEVVTNISAGTYALFAIRSDTRQTLQVETLPRPFTYRYKDYNNVAFQGSIPFYFNQEYEFTYPNGISTTAGSQLVTLSTLTYGSGRAAADAANGTQTLNILSNAKFFAVNAQPPVISPEDTQVVGYDYTLNFEVVATQPFPSPTGIFIYHDKAAFMADARNVRNENQFNYLSNFYVSAPTSTITVPLTVLAGTQYYVSVRPDPTSFTTTDFKLLTYWTDATSTPRKLLSNFDIVQPGVQLFSQQFGTAYDNTPSTVNYFFYKTYNSNYIRLPIQSNLIGSNPSDQQFNFIYPAAAPIIGYDDNGVSDDLTDYKGFIAGVSSFVPGAQFAVDPITQYAFNNLSPYNPSTAVQSYFYANSSNALLDPQVLTPYTPYFSTVTERQYKIAHYWDNTFIGPQDTDTPGYSLTGLPTLTTMQPYTSTTTAGYIGGYNYKKDTDLGVSTLRLGSGVCGINFVPSDGLWDIQRFTFKSAYMGAGDPNDEIQYIGIFDTNSVTNKNLSDINISSANAVLTFAEKQEYTPAVVAANNGFDPSFGTWRSFEIAPGFPYSRPDLVAQGLPGFTPYPCTIIGGERNFFTAIPFNNNFEVVNYFMLTGSAVPNPTASRATRVNTYFGYSNSNGAQMVRPIQTGPLPNGSNLYQSKYGQSIPIGTSLLNYNAALPLIEDTSAIQNYNPFGGFVGDVAFTLRSAFYTEGASEFLLFGDPTGARPWLVDVYLVRNPGEETRDTVFVNQFDLAAIIGVPTSQVITWGANTTGIYIVTRPIPTYDVDITKVANITTTQDVTLIQNVTMLGTNFEAPDGLIMPAFSTSTAKFFPRNNDTWLYYDDMSLDTGTVYPNYRGFIQYTLPGDINYTSVAYPRFPDAVGNPVPSFMSCGDVFVNPNSQFAYLLTTIPSSNQQWIQPFKFAQSFLAVPNFTLGTNDNRQSSAINPGIYILGTNYAPFFSNIMNDTSNNIYGFTSQNPTRFQFVSLLNAGSFIVPFGLPADTIPFSNVTLIASADSIPDYTATSNFGYSTDNNGGIFFSYQRGDIVSPLPIEIIGNAQVGEDIHYGMKTAYQLFYPTMKVEFTKRANKYNDITNLVDIDYYSSNVPYYEQFKTQAFYYSSFSNLMQDLGSPGNYKWGMESNFIRGDTGFQGYGFNSYIYNISLQSNTLNTNPSATRVQNLIGDANNYQWLAVRGYSPSENIETLIRFNLPNRYDYGLLTQPNLINEISSCLKTTNLSNFNPEYVNSLVAYNSNFILTSNYGQGSLSNFAGSTIRTTGYSNWYSVFSTMYGQYIPIANEVADIQGTVNSNLLQYISTYYGSILPSSIYLRTQITDATPYDLLFSTSVAPQLKNQATFWGLGYNLGFSGCLFTTACGGEGQNCYGPSNLTGNTVYTAPSFYKILDDYIYLQLNDELNMNRMDVTAQENFNVSLDGTGEVNKYNAKLLLANFGNYAQTLIQNTIRFNPPLPRLDRLTFRWIDINGNVIDNNDCEWSACLQITEQKQLATAASSIPRL